MSLHREMLYPSKRQLKPQSFPSYIHGEVHTDLYIVIYSIRTTAAITAKVATAGITRMHSRRIPSAINKLRADHQVAITEMTLSREADMVSCESDGSLTAEQTTD